MLPTLKKLIKQHEEANARIKSFHAERIRPTFDEVAEAQQKTVVRAKHIFARQKGIFLFLMKSMATMSNCQRNHRLKKLVYS